MAYQYQRGVTLIELLVAAVILGIAASLAVPSLTDSVRNQRLSSRSFAFQQDLAYARAEAVKLQGDVALSAIDGDFSNGWMVFEDGDSDQIRDSDERILRSQGEFVTGYTMKGGNGAGNPKAGLGFDRRGGLVGKGSFGLVICAPDYKAAKDKDYARNMRVSANGRAESAKGKGAHPGLSCG